VHFFWLLHFLHAPQSEFEQQLPPEYHVPPQHSPPLLSWHPWLLLHSLHELHPTFSHLRLLHFSHPPQSLSLQQSFPLYQVPPQHLPPVFAWQASLTQS